MKSLILTVAVLIVSISVFSQDKKIDKIKEVYAEQNYEECIKKSEKYIDNDKKNPEPYYYIAFSNFQQYIISKSISRDRLIQNSANQIIKGLNQDKDRAIFNSYKTEFDEIHDTLEFKADYYYAKDERDDAGYFYTYLAKIYNDTTDQYRDMFIPKELTRNQQLNFRGYTGPTNQLDKAGKKTGLWITKYRNGLIKSEIEYTNDKPVGSFRLYYPNGRLKADMYFNTTGQKARAVLYSDNGNKIAHGYYWKQKKDSLWQYFVNDSIVIREENYARGVKHGYETIINFAQYPSPIDEKFYNNGVQDSTWTQFYESGAVRFFCIYKDGKRNGDFNQFYDNINGSQRLKIGGQFENGLRVGTWKIWDEEKDKYQIIEYIKGVPENNEELSEEESKELEKMSDKAMEEIDMENFFPAGGDDY